MHIKEIIKKLSWITIVIFLLCDFARGQKETFQVVPGERIPDVLNTIATHVHANFLQIQSWEGDIDVSRTVVYKENAKDVFERDTDAFGKVPNRIVKSTESSTTFSSDMAKGLLYAKVSRKTPSRYMDAADGRDLGTRSIPWYRISISTPQYLLHSSPNRMKDGKFVQRKAVKEKTDPNYPSRAEPPVFDPRDLFDARSPVWLHYPRIIEHIRKNGDYVVDGYALKVEQRTPPGDVQYRIHEPTRTSGGNVFFTRTFSSIVSYNMISLEVIHADGEIVRRQTLDYELVEGTYIPSEATYESFDADDGSLRYYKTQTFKNVQLNRSIPAEVFSYKNLGLENGDNFVDTILDKEYVFQGAMLVEVEKSKE